MPNEQPHDTLEAARAQLCSRNATGAWLCRSCPTPLEAGDIVQCVACAEATRQRSEEAERLRRRTEWQERQRSAGQRVLDQLPSWRHIRTAEGTAAVVDPRLVPLAERYDLARGSVLALGSSGSGKTSSTGRAVFRLVNKRLDALLERPRDAQAQADFEEICRARWLTGCDVDRCLSAHRLGTGAEAEAITGAVQASILVLDELGPERAHQAGAIFDLVDRRSKRGRPTIVTSGLSAQAFQDRYGSGMLRRLTEKGLGALVDLHGQPGGRGA